MDAGEEMLDLAEFCLKGMTRRSWLYSKYGVPQFMASMQT